MSPGARRRELFPLIVRHGDGHGTPARVARGVARFERSQAGNDRTNTESSIAPATDTRLPQSFLRRKVVTQSDFFAHRAGARGDPGEHCCGATRKKALLIIRRCTRAPPLCGRCGRRPAGREQINCPGPTDTSGEMPAADIIAAGIYS